MSSDPTAKSHWNNQAGRDNIIIQIQTIIYNGSVLFFISISTFLIMQWKESKKRQVIKRLEFLKEELRPRIIENASYSDQAKRPCDPETRGDILQGIKSWIEDISEKSKCFYWLSGGPGVGKSTIAASIAEYCLDGHILGAQFFINRDDATTTDPRVLFPTISYQLCQRFRHTVAVVVEKIIRNQPSLLNDISKEQAAKLFVEAIDAAAATNRSRAVVVVIDALDETDPKRLWDLALILSTVVADLPRNAKVFITSRGENAIIQAFEPLRNCKQVVIESLVTTEEEVSWFMQKKVGEILKEYGIDWAKWGDDRMKRFSLPASGLYIWAQTALNLLRTEIHNSGTECFEEVLDTLTAEGMGDLNNLYLGILRRICKPGDDWAYERFRRIVGVILVRQTPLSIDDTAQLLNLKKRGTSKPVDVIHFVRQYRTLLVNDGKDIDGLVVPRMHRSFADFVSSESAEEFRVDKSASHGELALRCLVQFNQLITHFWPRKESSSRRFPVQLAYACQYWQLHLTRMVQPDSSDEVEERSNFSESDDSKDWPASLLGSADLKPDPAGIERKYSDLKLTFSPDGTQFALPHKSDILIWDTRTGTVITSLTSHAEVTNVGFSPDGTQLVSGSVDKTATIWDVRTRRVLHVLRGHHWVVCYAVFSHDGRIVATTSEDPDNTLRTYDTSTGQPLNVFVGHAPNGVYYCTFSPNDKRIASFSFQEIMVWDVDSGNLISQFYHEDCHIISFCPCGNHLMSHDIHEEIMLWDAESGTELDHTGPTNSARLAFVKELERESADTYIRVPPAIPNHKIPYICSLNTNYGNICGIVENGQGTWVSGGPYEHLYFSAGATRVDFS